MVSEQTFGGLSDEQKKKLAALKTDLEKSGAKDAEIEVSQKSESGEAVSEASADDMFFKLADEERELQEKLAEAETEAEKQTLSDAIGKNKLERIRREEKDREITFKLEEIAEIIGKTPEETKKIIEKFEGGKVEPEKEKIEGKKEQAAEKKLPPEPEKQPIAPKTEKKEKSVSAETPAVVKSSAERLAVKPKYSETFLLRILSKPEVINDPALFTYYQSQLEELEEYKKKTAGKRPVKTTERPAEKAQAVPEKPMPKFEQPPAPQAGEGGEKEKIPPKAEAEKAEEKAAEEKIKTMTYEEQIAQPLGGKAEAGQKAEKRAGKEEEKEEEEFPLGAEAYVRPMEKEKESEQEKTARFLNNLEKTRADYAAAYNNYRAAFGGIKEKDLKMFEDKIKPHRKFIAVGDSEKLQSKDESVSKEANLRKQNFVIQLIGLGMAKKEAEAIYEAELKKAEYDESKLFLARELKKQGMKEGEIFQHLILSERTALQMEQAEGWPPREKSIFRKGWEFWARRGTATKLLISTGLVTGVVALSGGFAAPAIALFAGQRFIRGAIGVLITKLGVAAIDVPLKRNIEAWKESSLTQLKEGFSAENLRKTEEEFKKMIDELATKEQSRLLAKIAVSLALGVGASAGLSMLERGLTGVKLAPSPEAPAVKSEFLTIGKRGPEGALINYFKGNSEIAKSFGWDGKADLTKWAGVKAHQLWLEDANEALAKPEILRQLEKFGYAPNAEGYAQMMHRIGKGFVEFNPQSGKVNLVEMTYLKARIPVAPVEAAPESVPLVEEIPPSEPSAVFKEIIAKETAERHIETVTSNTLGGFIEYLQFSPAEYGVIKGISLKQFLEQAHWDNWNAGTVDLPHHGVYDGFEFMCQLKLAETIRSLNPSGAELDMSVDEYLRTAIKGGQIGKFGAGEIGEIAPPEAIAPTEVEVAPAAVKADVVEQTTGAKGGKPVVEAAAEVKGIGVAEKISAVELSTGEKLDFVYNKGGKVVGFSDNNTFDFGAAEKEVLNENWRDAVLEKTAGRMNKHLYLNQVELQAARIASYQKILEALPGNSQEAAFLRNYISSLIEKTERQFGDVYK